MHLKKAALLLSFVSLCSVGVGQTQKYLIYFTDKASTPYTISNPSAFLSAKSIQRRTNQSIPVITRDLPVDPAYVDSVQSTGASLLYTSRWLNAVYVEADAGQLASILSFPFVQGNYNTGRKGQVVLSEKSKSKTKAKKTAMIDYGGSGTALNMIGIDDMHEQGMMGQEILIAVLDNGWLNAPSIDFFDRLFDSSRIKATYDFVDREADVYDDADHGVNVLSVLAAYKPTSIVGPAFDADYLLLRTEDAGSETHAELVYWLIAAEYADSAGADIINNSLGYNTFDNPAFDFVYDDMDGNTTVITKAADIAAQTGMIVVSSAGNEGGNSWDKILAPADGDSVLTVGAVNSAGNHASFSSKGPSFDGRTKPNVCAQGQGTTYGTFSGAVGAGNGTSLSAPLITGLAAGLWQILPSATAWEIKTYIEMSAHQYATPDNLLGYGIPDFTTAWNLGISASEGGLESKLSIYPNPASSKLIIDLNALNITDDYEISVVDLLGRKLLSEQIGETQNRPELDLKDFGNGVYTVIIETGRKTLTKRFIKN